VQKTNFLYEKETGPKSQPKRRKMKPKTHSVFIYILFRLNAATLIRVCDVTFFYNGIQKNSLFSIQNLISLQCLFSKVELLNDNCRVREQVVSVREGTRLTHSVLGVAVAVSISRRVAAQHVLIQLPVSGNVSFWSFWELGFCQNLIFFVCFRYGFWNLNFCG
jgi:hypothetical protein